jgi:hypothetical protein
MLTAPAGVPARREMQAALRQMYRILLGREHVPEGITPAFIADRLPPLPARCVATPQPGCPHKPAPVLETGLLGRPSRGVFTDGAHADPLHCRACMGREKVRC